MLFKSWEHYRLSAFTVPLQKLVRTGIAAPASSSPFLLPPFLLSLFLSPLLFLGPYSPHRSPRTENTARATQSQSPAVVSYPALRLSPLFSSLLPALIPPDCIRSGFCPQKVRGT